MAPLDVKELNSVSAEVLTLKYWTYDRGIRLSTDTNFSTLYLGRTKSLHFRQMKDYIQYDL
jgi:hypothetical protein